ncbi:MAG: glycosyltransferase family 9 protein [Alphaproteobacteria bacterium]|nr:glycosyltransferase family 9 protein [Alphaproteobacteria bacterium]
MKNILFITYTRIGDAVLSTGILNHLNQKYPDAKVTVACGPVAAPLFACVPNLDKVIIMDKKKYAGHWFSLWKECLPKKWDMVIDLRRSLIPYLLNTKSHKRLSSASSKSAVHRVPQIASVLGLQDNPPTPRIWIAPEHMGATKRRMGKAIENAGGKVLAIGPAANWRAKTWRSENFVELIKRITAKDGILPDAAVVVFGALAERHLVQDVINSVPEERLVDLVGGTSLLSAYACLERCSLYIGNDSGLMHMAAAAAIPTLGLFGPSREDLYAPWGDKTAYVRTVEDFDNIYPPDFDHRTADTLMDSLTVDMAEEAVNKLWNKVHNKKKVAKSSDEIAGDNDNMDASS